MRRQIRRPPESLTSHRFLTVQEVEKALRVSDTTVKKLITTGQLKAIRVGRSYRIIEQSFTEYIERQLDT